MKTIESEEIMLQVGSALVSLDVIERFFICDLEKCLGACCIEGDAGAPVSDLVTSIVNGKDCVFTCYGKNGMCQCAVEKAFREGKIDFYKPVSCHLYPVRLKEYKDFAAVNYHRWKICKAAEVLGRREKVRVYEFLKEPLIRRFGEKWYNDLCEAAEAYLKEYGK